MARQSISITAAGALGAPKDAVNTVSTTAVAADVALLVTDIGVLVADGASPTQAHVTTLNGHMTTFNTDWAALLVGTGGVPSGADLVVSFDETKWTQTTLRQAFAQIIQSIAGGQGNLSP